MRNIGRPRVEAKVISKGSLQIKKKCVDFSTLRGGEGLSLTPQSSILVSFFNLDLGTLLKQIKTVDTSPVCPPYSQSHLPHTSHLLFVQNIVHIIFKHHHTPQHRLGPALDITTPTQSHNQNGVNLSQLAHTHCIVPCMIGQFYDH